MNLKNPINAISCFDLDDTLVVGNSSFRFYLYLCRKGVLSYASIPYALLCFLRFRFFKLSLAGLHHRIFKRFLKGKYLSKIEDHVAAFLEKELSKLFYTPVILKLKEAKKQGHFTVILSSSPSFLVRKISEYLGVDSFFASQYATDDFGRFSNIESVVLGEDKKNILSHLLKQLNLTCQQAIAYSDSILDLPLLQFVGKPIAVRPDPVLSNLCKKNQWDIL